MSLVGFSRGRHNGDRHVSMMENIVADAAEECSSDGTHSAVAHHYVVDILLFAGMNHGLSGMWNVASVRKLALQVVIFQHLHILVSQIVHFFVLLFQQILNVRIGNRS